MSKRSKFVRNKENLAPKLDLFNTTPAKIVQEPKKRLNFQELRTIKCNLCQNSPALFFNDCGCFYCKACNEDSRKCLNSN